MQRCKVATIVLKRLLRMNAEILQKFAELGRGLLSPDWVKATLIVAMIVAWMIVALCGYLARTTKREHYKLWTVAWLFYGAHLVVTLLMQELPAAGLLRMARLDSLGLSALFLFWGALQVAEIRVRWSLMGAGAVTVLLWGHAAGFWLAEATWTTVPVVGLLGAANVFAGVHFARDRRQSRAASVLAFGFVAWGAYLLATACLDRWVGWRVGGYVASSILMLVVAMGLMLREESAASEEKYRALLDSSNDAIFMVDLWTQRVLDANKAAARLTKYSPADLLKRSFMELCPDLRKKGDSQVQLREMFQDVFRAYSEFNIVRADQGLVVCEGDVNLSQWRSRPVMQVTVKEVDKSRTVGKFVRRAEKLSSLGQLVAGVAHELNNPLAVVVGYSQLLAKQTDLDPKVSTAMSKVLHESERASKIVRDLLSFARPCEPQMSTVNINELICNVLNIRETELRGNQIQDQIYLAPNLPTTRADPIQIEQVVNNLVTNAIHALQGRPAAERRLKISTERSGIYIRVSIADSGSGIPEPIRERIFDPFFTTKAPGKGTGLGLSISSTIMQEHHGKIWCESEVGKWTEFHLEFPVVETPADAPAALVAEKPKSPAVASTAPVVQNRLLVVDDEPGIREVLAEVLICSGYLVETAGDGAEALKKLDNQKFDLVISDLCMPEMDGPTLFRTIQQKHKKMAGRVLFVTGDTVSPKSREFLEQSGNRWLSKPFNIRDIEETVRSTLAEANTVAAPEFLGMAGVTGL